jgi:hypothetical protein
MMRALIAAAVAVWFALLLVSVEPIAGLATTRGKAPADDDAPRFTTAGTCMACHNGLTTPAGEDVSIGTDWRGTIMANSSRDPYWQAAVRREVLDHPGQMEEIEDECATCHMPMSRRLAHEGGVKARVFEHLPAGGGRDPDDLLAHDGVSCTICHQISDEKLGTPESFTGGFTLASRDATGRVPMFGPFEIDRGRQRVMHSSTGFAPTAGAHIRQSELCATCHTLYTTARDRSGQPTGKFPEQVPYLEWRHSAFAAEERSCQSCHMPTVRGATPIASVMGEPREGLARHIFRGGNFFMLGMLNRYRTELGVTALPQELAAVARWTVEQLRSQTASLSIERAAIVEGRLHVDIVVQNLSGHKLPSAYPSRRAWLDVTVTDASGRELFRSGSIAPSGFIEGNDNDADPARFEPHHTEIRSGDQVQMYEAVLLDSEGAVTTGLLKAVRYGKDNRLLPRGFDKTTAPMDAAVHGDASADADFVGGTDRIRYSVAVSVSGAPFTARVALRFQPIAYRWAQNLRAYNAAETRRFVSMFESMAAASSEVLATAAVTSK